MKLQAKQITENLERTVGMQRTVALRYSKTRHDTANLKQSTVYLPLADKIKNKNKLDSCKGLS